MRYFMYCQQVQYWQWQQHMMMLARQTQPNPKLQ
jgi:hypothetical protein